MATSPENGFASRLRLPSVLPPAEGAYAVGGCIRDLLAGRTPTDFDVAVLNDPPSYARMIAAAAAGHVVSIGKPAFRIWRVMTPRATIDVSAAAGATIAEDLGRRDFTVNAMAVSLRTGELIDPCHGRRDLAGRRLRLVSDAAFAEDPLRLLRAFRLSAGLNFEIEPRTLAAIRRDAGLLPRAAGERIRDELFKMLSSGRCNRQLSQMAATRLLAAVFPEFESLAPHGLEDALRRQREAEALLQGAQPDSRGLAARLRRQLPERRRVLGQLAALLQPVCRPAPAAGDRNGARLKRMLERLRLSNADAAVLDFLLRRTTPLLDAFHAAGWGRKGELRLVRAARDLLPDWVAQVVCGIHAGSADVARCGGTFLALAEGVLVRYEAVYRPRFKRPPPITGEDLIDALGLSPSPRFRELLEMVAEAYFFRGRMSRAEALELVRDRLCGRSETPPSPGARK
jgi:tRNA nucleotidyltransferase/poly(A) polymerase